jgi:hypothetical protein
MSRRRASVVEMVLLLPLLLLFVMLLLLGDVADGDVVEEGESDAFRSGISGFLCK